MKKTRQRLVIMNFGIEAIFLLVTSVLILMWGRGVMHKKYLVHLIVLEVYSALTLLLLIAFLLPSIFYKAWKLHGSDEKQYREMLGNNLGWDDILAQMKIDRAFYGDLKGLRDPLIAECVRRDNFGKIEELDISGSYIKYMTYLMKKRVNNQLKARTTEEKETDETSDSLSVSIIISDDDGGEGESCIVFSQNTSNLSAGLANSEFLASGYFLDTSKKNKKKN